jgi:succinyl-diaminopimelate desuccinylase
LQKVYRDKTGKEPRLISYGGGTYAKSLKNIVAFGPLFEGEPDLCHKPNECMSIEGLVKNIQIIAAAMVELAK